MSVVAGARACSAADARLIRPAEVGQRKGTAVGHLDARLHVGNAVEHDAVVIAERAQLLVAALVGVRGVAMRSGRHRRSESDGWVRYWSAARIWLFDVDTSPAPTCAISSIEASCPLTSLSSAPIVFTASMARASTRTRSSPMPESTRLAQAPQHHSPPASSTAPLRTTVM